MAFDEAPFGYAFGAGTTAAAAARQIRAWLAASKHQLLLRLWVEGYAQSLIDQGGPWDPLRAKRSAIGSTYSPGSSEAPHTSSSPAGTRRLLCTTELCGSIVHIEPPSLNRRIRPHGGTKHQGSPTMRRKSGTSIQQFLAMRYRWWSRHSLHTQPCAYARRFAHPILSKGGLAVFLVAWSSTHS